MNDKDLYEAIRNFMDAGRITTSAEMRLVCRGLASLAFSINELQKRLQLVERKLARLRCEIFRNCLAAKKRILTTKLLKVISGGQTGVDRGALDAALVLQVECGGWCPAGRLAEDGPIPKRYPVMELANAGYAERTARNVTDSDGTLVISNGVLLGGTRETVDRCTEKRKPHLIIDCAKRSVQETIETATEFVANLSFRVARTKAVRLGARNLSNVRKSPGELGDPLYSRRLTIVLNVAGPRASQWPEGHKTAQRIVSGILSRLVDRTRPLNTVRDSPSGDP